jgi:radical SAM superfamily enzyme YgiQ (UPF0313 family)
MIHISSMKKDAPHILLINPWIHDFAAYDFWAKPLGLLQLASILRLHKFGISYVDCLDRYHPDMPAQRGRFRNGRGPYFKTRIAKPVGLEDIKRNYCRYGITVNAFKQSLLSVPKPDLVLVTSLMTYWYAGIQETIQVIREVFEQTPVVLGGIYAGLYPDHAEKSSGADRVVSRPDDPCILELVEQQTGFSVTPLYDAEKMDTYPYPAYDLQHQIHYVPLLTSTGCPFACAYCASRFLQPNRRTRSPASVVEEIKFWHTRHGIIDFAFYDDALLVNAANHILPILEGTIQAGVSARFHTPNAVHVREISQEVAGLMFKAGFETIRLGIETADFDNRKNMDAKVTAREFSKGIRRLKAAGFRSDQIGAYLLVGLPNQSMTSVAESIKIVKAGGIVPVMAYYSPIPHTPMWQSAVASSRYDLESDPIYTNNAIWPCSKEPFSWQIGSRLKNLIRS